MKSEKGITLVSLVVYIVIFMIILGVMSAITSSFNKNIEGIKEPQKYITEFNKFCMFFVRDVKNNTQATVTSNQIVFEDGTKYEYKDNKIYRNDELITKYIKECEFLASTHELEVLTKNLIDINMTIGTENEQIKRNIEFVLKYW